jgi:phosphatidylserine/phosphatidylglycerophosphate/cardiolipin synthase-like enzyme
VSTDPDLVRAIYRRKQAVPGLQVAIVTNPNGGGVGYLTRRAWMHMALRHPTCRSLTYTSKNDPTGSKVVARGAGPAPAWQVEDNYTPNVPTWHQWLESDGLRIAKTSAGSHLVDTKKKTFHEVLDVDVDFHFYTPAVHVGWTPLGGGVVPAFRTLCIHSKLAIIDDYLICGSSNWTYRSLQYDGEISLFMQSNALANATLARLLGHYDTVNAVNLGNIEATTRATADAILAARSPNIHHADSFVLLPLEYRPFEMGPSTCLFWGNASPAHSTVDRVRNAGERLARLKTDLPDWTWW